MFPEYSILPSIGLSVAKSAQKITANSTYWEANLDGAGGGRMIKGKGRAVLKVNPKLSFTRKIPAHRKLFCGCGTSTAQNMREPTCFLPGLRTLHEVSSQRQILLRQVLEGFFLNVVFKEIKNIILIICYFII